MKPRTVEQLHRTKDKPVKVLCGPAYRPPGRRPQRRAARVGPQALAWNLDELLARALTPEARQACALDPSAARLFVRALAATAAGYSRALELVEDDAGVWVACRWPHRRLGPPEPITWRAP